MRRSARLASWAIRFAASLDGVLTVLSGMSNFEQLRDNMSYMKAFVPLKEDEKTVLRKVVSAIRSAISIPCTGCNYCTVGCPQHIRIPEYFTLYNAEKRAPSKIISLQQVYENHTQNAGKASDWHRLRAMRTAMSAAYRNYPAFKGDCGNL